MKRDSGERILKAAVQIFSKRGWQEATTLEIARAARVNEVTLFRRFGNKDQLFKAVIQRTVSFQARALQQSIDHGLPLEQAMKLYAAALYKSLTLNKSLVRSMINDKSELRCQVIKHVRNTVEPVIDQLTFFLEKCQQRGEIAAHLNCEILRESFSSMVFSFAIKPKLRPRNYTTQKYLDTAVEVFVKGVKP
ncbi:MAG: TetR/AcrR family transcriptional regulator [Verrucomicrobiales bacterium]|jgi:AcrR family transcriptional regulator|nr:TetR/AcrR family transcriptional regulator [Verrucomicrobiales bacterium]